MVTMLDVIARTSSKIDEIIAIRKEIFQEIIEVVKKEKFEELVLIGSGSSYSTALSSFLFMEKASGIETYPLLPNLFTNKTVLNKKALYIFISQTGTSSLTASVAKRLTKDGYHTLALSGTKDAPVAENCRYFALIGVGYEEYTYATLGFSCSIMTEMLLAMEIGLATGHLTIDQYYEYLSQAKAVGQSNEMTITKTLKWFEENKKDLLNVTNFIIYGGGPLYGIANEGALKIMEITKKYVSVGYEMDDGLHGPNYCLDERTAVFALNDGKDSQKAISLMNLMKKEYQTGYMIGKHCMEEKDLPLDFVTDDFTNLEIISFLQVVAYMLACEIKVDIFQRSDERINHTKGKGYFDMHAS